MFCTLSANFCHITVHTSNLLPRPVHARIYSIVNNKNSVHNLNQLLPCSISQWLYEERKIYERIYDIMPNL